VFGEELNPSDVVARCASSSTHVVNFKPTGCFVQVTLCNDIVAVEDRPRFVTRDSHCHPLRNACSHHVPHRGSSEVMKQLPFRLEICKVAVNSPLYARLAEPSQLIGPAMSRLAQHRPIFPSDDIRDQTL
jgi:hypothetical protein